MNAATRQSLKTIARHKENIARPKRAKKPTAKLKIAVGTATLKINQKTWMMRLQHPGSHGL
jgi:hypothetical protein